MTSAHESLPDNDAERLLASLAGIISAHVVTDSIGRPVEIHILSAAELHPKQVVRNVESALSAGLGISIDRRIVSVAQVRAAGTNGHAAPPGDDVMAVAPGSPDRTHPAEQPDAHGSAAAPRNGGARKKKGKEDRPDARLEPRREPARLEYVRFASRRDAERCACDVILRDGDREVTGTGSGADTAAGRAEAAARAVLDAISRARGDVRLVLEGAVISASRGRSFVIVSAHALLDRTNVALAGAAPMTRSPEEAGILAALQATNRWSG